MGRVKNSLEKLNIVRKRLNYMEKLKIAGKSYKRLKITRQS